MAKKIIGLIGESGSGKDTLCRYLKRKRKNVFCFRFSQFLTEALQIFVDQIKREDQQWLGILLRQRFGSNILGEALKKRIKSIKNGLIILNGIRYEDEYKMVKKLKGKIIYVTGNAKIRWQRIKKRREKKDDNVSYQKFLQLEKNKTEINVPFLGKKADFKIINNGSLKEFYSQIAQIIKKI